MTANKICSICGKKSWGRTCRECYLKNKYKGKLTNSVTLRKLKRGEVLISCGGKSKLRMSSMGTKAGDYAK